MVIVGRSLPQTAYTFRITTTEGMGPRLRGDDMECVGGAVRGLLPILLDAGGAQSGKAMLVDGKLPGQEFVDGQGVAAAGFLEGEQAAADRGNDFGLAADHPPFGPGR